MPDTEKSMHDQIVEIVNNCFSDEMLYRAIQEQMKNSVGKIVEDLFSGWGGINKVIEEKLKETMVPAIKTYDFSKYITRVDTMLTELANDPDVMANKRILDNFRTILTPPDSRTVSLKDLFKKYCNFVADNIDTSGRGVNYDCGIQYEDVECSTLIEDDQSEYAYRDDYERWRVTFRTDEGKSEETENGEPLNYDIILYRWNIFQDHEYIMQIAVNPHNLSAMSSFEAYLNSLISAGVRVTVENDLDDTYFEESVTPSKEPEPTYE